MSDAIIERDDTGWFDRLCAEKGLAPASPKLSQDIVAGDVLFSAFGDPRPVIRVKRFAKWVRIYHGQGDQVVWDNDLTITLIATPLASEVASP